MAADASTAPIADHRNNNIDTLRLLAALTVLYAHSFVLAKPGNRDPITDNLQEILPLQRGISGQAVALFFVVSGYLVSASFDRRRELASYAAARLLRILPALWAAIIVMVVVAALVTTLPIAEFLARKTTIGFALHNGTLFDMRFQLAEVFTANPRSDVNVSLWTLPLEFLMYIVVALVGLIGLLKHRLLFNCAIALAFASFVLGGGQLPLIHGHHDAELLLYFMAGAALYVNRDVIKLHALPALLLLAAAMALSPLKEHVADVAIIFFFSYFVLWLGFTRRIRMPNLAARGDLSYATYLYAAFVTQLWLWAIGPFNGWLVALATAAVTLPLAWLSWHYAESPALARKGWLAERFRSLPRGGRGAGPAAVNAPSSPQ